MLGMPITYHRAESANEGSLLFAIIAGAVLTSPLLFLAFWIAYDGDGYMKRIELEQVSHSDPVADAEEAIGKGDLWLYTTGSYLDRKAPGFGEPNYTYGTTYGFRHLSLITDHPLSEEEEAINRAALRYMEAYNHHVHDEAEKRARQLQAMKGG